MKEPFARPTWDQYFLLQALIASLRASCLRAKHGCVIVAPDRTVVATGYNGAPSGLPQCDEDGCRMIQGHCLRCRHAEINAIQSALRFRRNLEGLTVYVTGESCNDCARALIRESVGRVVVGSPYGKSEARTLFAEAGIAYEMIPYEEFLPHLGLWIKGSFVGKSPALLTRISESLTELASQVSAPAMDGAK